MFFLFSPDNSMAQLKIAHINTNELIRSMPEVDSVNVQLEALNQEYTKAGEELQNDYNTANAEYQKNLDTMSDLIKQTKEDALNDMLARIQQFVANSRQDLQNKENELFQPILIKAQNAVQEVADENKFDYVLDTGTGAILTVPKDESYNIMKLVQAKLGITVK